MTTVSPILIVTTAAFVAVMAPAYASGSCGIYTYSQEASNETAHAGGSISYHESSGGSQGSQVSYSTTPIPEEGPPGSGESTAAPASSPSAGRVAPCVEAGEGTVSPCYGVIPNPTPALAPVPNSRQRPVNPAVLAASAADRLSLVSGRIEVSPSAQVRGLTGLASWFWLSPSPALQSLSV